MGGFSNFQNQLPRRVVLYMLEEPHRFETHRIWRGILPYQADDDDPPAARMRPLRVIPHDTATLPGAI